MAGDFVRRFRIALETHSNPHLALIDVFGADLESLVPIVWDDRNGPRHRHAGAHDPAVRLCEPQQPDVTGAKYVVAGGGPPSRAMPLIPAVRWLVDRERVEDAVVVHGSRRPIVSWRTVGRRTVPRVDYVGASIAEAKAAETSGLLVESGTDPVILRIRMRRATLERIKRVAEHERQLYNDGRTGKYMSAAVLTPILDWLERREAEVEAIAAAGFEPAP